MMEYLLFHTVVGDRFWRWIAARFDMVLVPASSQRRDRHPYRVMHTHNTTL